MSLKHYIGIDLGGTNIKAGIFNEKGVLKFKKSIPTLKEKKFEGIAEDMINLSYEITRSADIDFENVAGIGIGVPGTVDVENGVIVYSNNLDWTMSPIVSTIEKVTKKPVFIANDANVAALGEAKFGSGKDYDSSILITLGTGVGGGIIIDGKLFEGYKSAGAEVGHMVILENGEQCTCGRKGCFEAYASASALVRDTKNTMKYHKKSKMWDIVGGDINNVDGRTCFDAARQNDRYGKEVVDIYIKHLSEGIVNLINILRPEAVILGGGVCNEGDFLIEPLKELVYLKMYGGNDYAPVEIKVASLGNDAGIIGAFSYVLQNLEK